MEEQVSEEPTTKATCSNTEKEEQQAENVPENTEDTDAASGSKLEKSTDSTDEVQQSDEVEVDPAVIEKFTLGVLEMFLPNLQKAKSSLNEVLHNQEVLIETVQQENSKFTDSDCMKKLIDTMQEAKHYHMKLVNLKREMNGLMDKSTKLKRRAVKLQQEKQREELRRAVQIEKEQERERMLTAKVAKPSQKKQNTQT
ncbi:biogenesis of lysosome-related organelles complex 1 subunit 6-like [Ruditapes philippinarum]|uniref:biogenesis of lysosome-related organelles complex 1 subunit 6-like n=1 Tax=Ruditapes philippinarum TaxID=129788 RepID=UPI00295BEFFD|nr:biogenesis of lysosome-related organelles complex 1 subunit 6-like [Ruditapes philippinarum]XP_060591583.1 biogenesis of lysosome-related organelles complex 1 subunit 6-like [Ruditapes philippinarum]